MRCGMGVDAVSGETAGSIYTTRIKTFMKKVLQSCSRSGGIQHADSAITKHEAGCWPGVFQKPATTLRGTYVFEGSCSHRGTDRSDRSCIQPALSRRTEGCSLHQKFGRHPLSMLQPHLLKALFGYGQLWQVHLAVLAGLERWQDERTRDQKKAQPMRWSFEL